MFKTLLATLALSLAISGAAAASTVVGATAIDRTFGDSYSNFAIALTDDILPTGTITGWETWIEAIDGGDTFGTMALMVLNDLGGGNFTVKDFDFESVQLGSNIFSTSMTVAAGDILAIFMGTAKVSFDLGGSGSDPYTDNGAFGLTPAVNDALVIAGFTTRTYSINATVAAVPLPAGAPLLLAGLGGLAALRRRKSV